MLKKHTSDGFMEQVAEKGGYMRERLASMPNVREVRGLGMMLGIVLEKGEAKPAAQECLKNGLLVLTAKTLLRLLPPLTITYDEIDKGLLIMEAVLKGV